MMLVGSLTEILKTKKCSNHRLGVYNNYYRNDIF